MFNKMIRTVFAFFLFSSLVFADVPDGGQYDCGGVIVTFDVKVVPIMGTAEITITTDGGDSTTTSGSPGDGGEANPTVSDMDPVTLGDKEVKVVDGKVKYKNKGGIWVTAKKKRTTKAPSLEPGEIIG